MAKFPKNFTWVSKQEATSDPIESDKIIESQVNIMQHLFRPTKQPQTLAMWHKRRGPGDLHLYAAFGLIEPVEYQYLLHYMNRWQDAIQKAEAGEVEGPKRVGHFLQDMANKDFDKFESMALRMEHPVRFVNKLVDMLYLENTRRNHSEGVSVTDELLCQHAYPANEYEGWIWMNKMVAGQSKSPLDIPLKETECALEELNDFQLYNAVADIHNYGLEPLATQRLNGRLATCLFPRRLPRIHAALLYLRQAKILNGERLDKVLRMGEKMREQEELRLKRTAVSAFLSDIARSAPDPVLLAKMVQSFGVYFAGILAQIGIPTLGTKRVCVRGENGKAKFVHVVDVSFTNPRNDKAKNQLPKTNQTNATDITR